MRDGQPTLTIIMVRILASMGEGCREPSSSTSKPCSSPVQPSPQDNQAKSNKHHQNNKEADIDRCDGSASKKMRTAAPSLDWPAEGLSLPTTPVRILPGSVWTTQQHKRASMNGGGCDNIMSSSSRLTTVPPPPPPQEPPPPIQHVVPLLVVGPPSTGKTHWIHSFVHRQPLCLSSTAASRPLDSEHQQVAHPSEEATWNWSMEYHKKDYSFYPWVNPLSVSSPSDLPDEGPLERNELVTVRIQFWDTQGVGPLTHLPYPPSPGDQVQEDASATPPTAQSIEDWYSWTQMTSSIQQVLLLVAWPDLEMNRGDIAVLVNTIRETVQIWKAWLDQAAPGKPVALILTQADRMGRHPHPLHPVLWMRLGGALERLCQEFNLTRWYTVTSHRSPDPAVRHHGLAESTDAVVQSLVQASIQHQKRLARSQPATMAMVTPEKSAIASPDASLQKAEVAESDHISQSTVVITGEAVVPINDDDGEI